MRPLIYGPHVHVREDLRSAVDFAIQARSSVIKCLNGAMDRAELSRAREHGITVIGRVYESNQGLGNPYEGRMIDRILEHARRYPEVQIWEGFNEAFQFGAELGRRAQFDIDLMQAMESIDRLAGIGSFSVGQPQLGDWRWYKPALEYAGDRHLVALHEYGGPVMQWGVGPVNQWNDGDWRLNDPCDRGDELGFFVLRYRRAVRVWKQLGIDPIPRLIITEGGLDDINPRPEPQGKGWRSYIGTEWENRQPFGDFADQLYWALWQMNRDKRADGTLLVMGYVGFGYGTADHSNPGIAQWWTFDIDGTPVKGRVVRLMHRLWDEEIGQEGDMDSRERAMRRWIAEQQVISPNVNAALERAIRTDGYQLLTSEGRTETVDGEELAVQGAYLPGRPPEFERVYYVPVPEPGEPWGDPEWVWRYEDGPEHQQLAWGWPIGPEDERMGREMPSGWYSAVDFAEEYAPGGEPALHTGLDLNLTTGGNSDLGQPVYAAADGSVVASDWYPVWGNVVVIEHDYPVIGRRWTRYGHLQYRTVSAGDEVRVGDRLGTIGRGENDQFPAHLHFDVMKKQVRPTHWPGTDRAELMDVYENPTDVLSRA